MTASDSPLHDIDHVVVLMFENRSFDNILGRLYTGELAKAKGFDGLPLDSVNYATPGDPSSTAYQVWTNDKSILDRKTMTIPTPDPGELFSQMNLQIFGKTFGVQPKHDPVNPGPPPNAPNMSGFAASYAAPKPAGAGGDPRDIMHYFSVEQLPVSHFLGLNYAVSDRWHGSSPTQTFPNRLFAHCASSGGMINNTQVLEVLAEEEILHDLPSIFDQLDALAATETRIPPGTRRWKVYYHDFPISALVRHVRDNWKFGDPDSPVSHFSDLDLPWTTTGTSFYHDLENDHLPAYSFIEPRYGLLQNIGLEPIVPPNDNHPPFNLAFGELLLYDVWNALRQYKNWNNTLLVVTYDEHGGCYDHASPTAVAPSPSGDPNDHPFVRYGPRVPALLISPRIQPGGVLKPAPDPETGVLYPFDHSSIIKTVRECFALGDAATQSLNQRDRFAPSLAPVLDASPPHLNRIPGDALERPAVEVTPEDIAWIKKVGPSDLVQSIMQVVDRLGLEIPKGPAG